MKLQNRPGIALIEAIVALAILAIAGSAWMALGAQSSRTLSQVHERERAVRTASQVMSRYGILSRAELAASSGRRRHGAHLVRISQVRAGLFEIEVIADDRATGSLRTMLYRPALDSTADAP